MKTTTVYVVKYWEGTEVTDGDHEKRIYHGTTTDPNVGTKGKTISVALTKGGSGFFNYDNYGTTMEEAKEKVIKLASKKLKALEAKCNELKSLIEEFSK